MATVEQFDLFGKPKILKSRKSATSCNAYSNTNGHYVMISKVGKKFTYSLDGEPVDSIFDRKSDLIQYANKSIVKIQNIQGSTIHIRKTKDGEFAPQYPRGNMLCVPKKTLHEAIDNANMNVSLDMTADNNTDTAWQNRY